MSSSLPSPEELKGAVQGTILYLALYFPVFTTFKAMSKSKLLKEKKKELSDSSADDDDDEKRTKKNRIYLSTVKYYNARDVEALRADRTIANYIEKGFLFLPLLWLHAVFVDPSHSRAICVLFTIVNALFPVLFTGTWIPAGMPDLLGLFCMAPTCLIIAYLFFQVTMKFCIA